MLTDFNARFWFLRMSINNAQTSDKVNHKYERHEENEYEDWKHFKMIYSSLNIDYVKKAFILFIQHNTATEEWEIDFVFFAVLWLKNVQQVCLSLNI